MSLALNLLYSCSGAKLIDGKVLARIEVHGKNLFYFFGEGADQVVMHIHFGMSGRFRVSPLPGPETTPTTRLQLINDSQGIVANLSAMTVQHGDLGAISAPIFPLCPSVLRTYKCLISPCQYLHILS